MKKDTDYGKRFQQILEYTLNVKNGIVDEADDEPQGGPDAGADMPPMDNGEGAPQDDPNASEATPPMDGGDSAPQGGPNDGADIPPMDSGAGASQGGPEGFDPQMPQGEEGTDVPATDDGTVYGGEGGPMQPDDEVLDVTELADSQETTEKKVNALNHEFNEKFDKVFKSLSKFEDMIKSNDEALKKLGVEFEKRNPTPIEKLNMQTAHSYPFNITPNEYWTKKEATSNYQAEEQPQEFTITRGDVSNNLDWGQIAKTLNEETMIYHQTLENTMPED